LTLCFALKKVSPNIYTLNAFCTKHNFSIQFLVYISHCSIRYFKYFGAFFELRSFFSISVIFNFFLPFFPVCHTVWSGGDMVFFWSLQVCMVIWYGMVWYGMVILEYLIGFFRGGGQCGSAVGSEGPRLGPRGWRGGPSHRGIPVTPPPRPPPQRPRTPPAPCGWKRTTPGGRGRGLGMGTGRCLLHPFLPSLPHAFGDRVSSILLPPGVFYIESIP